ncbi:MAG: hypothetical protein V3V56_05315 [bacterium]
MASISRACAPAGFFAGGSAATLLAATLLAVVSLAAFPPLPAGAKEPEGGVFPGEKDRLPAKEEKDALGLLFGKADLFLASEGQPAENFRVFWALENPKRFSAKKAAQGAPRPPMDFLGWGMIAWRGGTLHLAAFGPSGRFRGGATSPADRLAGPLKKLLQSMVGRWPKDAAARLRAYAEIDPGRAARLGLRIWEDFFAGFQIVHASTGSVAPPPARRVPRPPGLGTMAKVIAVILVVALISLFNVGLARQRRQRIREEMERKFDRRRPQWRA